MCASRPKKLSNKDRNLDINKKIIETKNQPPLIDYDLKNYLPESIEMRNLIYFAHDKQDGQNVVIKFCNHSSLENEYNIMKECSHSNLMGAKHFFKTDNYCGIVMPKADGGDLYEYVSSHDPMNESDIRHVMKSLFSALEHLHGLNLTHHDVKLENIFIMGTTITSTIVLGDLEFVSKIASKNRGTDNYHAPEKYDATKECTNKIDIWAASVVMYALIYMHFPFYVQGQFDDLNFDNPETVVSNEAIDLMTHLFEIDPTGRYTAAQALDHPWFRLNLVEGEECNQRRTYEQQLPDNEKID